MVNFKFNIQKHLTLRERIADTVREAIIQGNLRPAEKVSELELASKFGISRTPIREAFRQLESEGFLQVMPRKGAIVKNITDKDIREFYEIKGVLEGYAAKIAVDRLNEKDIQRMENLNNQIEAYFKEGNRKAIFKIHNEFHEVFLKACGNEKLFQLIQSLVQQFQCFRISLALSGRMEGSIAQHKSIINAFKKRDRDLVEKLVKENAVYGGEILVKEILHRQEFE